MHLSQPGFTYSDCGPLTNNKVQIQKLKKTKKIQEIYIQMN